MTDQQQVHLFVSEDGQAQLEVTLEKETVWLSQAQMALLFDTSTDNIGLHLKNIELWSRVVFSGLIKQRPG